MPSAVKWPVWVFSSKLPCEDETCAHDQDLLDTCVANEQETKKGKPQEMLGFDPGSEPVAFGLFVFCNDWSQ